MDMQAEYAVPKSVLPYVGKIVDIDAHEHTPVNRWVDTFGSVAAQLVEAVQASTHPANEFKAADDTELTPDNLWNQKRAEAPGSFDMKRRDQVMDMMGVEKQLMFPGVMGLQAMVLLATADTPEVWHKSINTNRAAYAKQLIEAYNEWSVRIAAEHSRLRPVAVLMGETVEDLESEARRWLSRGIRALWMPSSILPGGRSPAHTDLDKLYDIIAQGNATLCAHVGADLGFLKTERWRDAPAFQGYKWGGEFSLDPWTLNNMSKATENFIATIILGGVFERHPNLQYGVAEVAAHWVGPLAYSMDMWIENSGAFNKKNTGWAMRLKPSEYMQRNVRVSPFDFEDVGFYIKSFGLEDVYCYASDFPHIEGGKDPMRRFSESLEAHNISEDVRRKFFVENGRWVLPD